ncbi:copper transport protein ATX1 [Oryza brachyantha]|uniref:HMA domain-containing protein n=1 Tax=Oryza brachyantha TaxID=4533 RepID=J3LDG1_ORYBR|nr:copper transport protein ATX1 [Oryza brachyantha]
MAAETVVLKVGMSCQGCAGAVKRVLTKMEGVETFDIDLEQQKVTVKGNVKPEDVFQTVSKTGKKTSFWEAEASSAPAPAPAPATTEAAAPPTTTAAEAPAAAAAAASAAPEAPPAKADA